MFGEVNIVDRLKSYRHFVLPVALILMLAVSVNISTLFWLSIDGDSAEMSEQQHLAQLMVRSRTDFMKRNIGDYALWDDAVSHLALDVDRTWADDNIGPYLYRLQGYEYSIVVDSAGRTVYSSDRTHVVDLPYEKLIGTPMVATLAPLLKAPHGTDSRISGLTVVDGKLIVYSAAAIVPSPGKVALPVGRERFLILADVLDAHQLLHLGRTYGIEALRFTMDKHPGAIPLTADGRPLGYLAWDLDKPGTRQLEQVLPVVGFITLLLIAGGAWVIVIGNRAMRGQLEAAAEAEVQAAQAIDARNETSRVEGAARVELQRTVARVKADRDRLHGAADKSRRAAMAEAAARLESQLGPILERVVGEAFSVAAAAEDTRGRTASVSSQILEAVRLMIDAGDRTTHVIPNARALQDASADIARQANEALHRARAAIADGGTAASEVSQLIAAIENVGSFVDAIEAISRQTNLLALNATIEAARAGAAGSGFSVVAAEVKGLAAETSNLTRKVNDYIGMIRTMSQSTADALSMLTSALSAGEALSDRIVDAMESQNRSTVEMVKAIGDVADNTRSAVAAMSQVEGDLAKGAESADELDTLAGAVSDDFERLNAAVGAFLTD